MFLELPAELNRWGYLETRDNWVFIAGVDQTDNSAIPPKDAELFYLSMSDGRIYRISYLYGLVCSYPLDNINRMNTFYRYLEETVNESNLVTVRKKLEPYLLLYNL